MNSINLLWTTTLLIVMFSNTSTTNDVPHDEYKPDFACDDSILGDITFNECSCKNKDTILCNFTGPNYLSEYFRNMTQYGYNRIQHLHVTVTYWIQLVKNGMDITELKSFTDLRVLSIITDFIDIPHPIKILYNNETFSSMRYLKELQINVPLNISAPIESIIHPLTGLTSLDLSYTWNIGNHLQRSISHLNNEIETIKFRSFQEITLPNRLLTFDVRAVFPRVLRNIRNVDLSFNYLQVVTVGWFSTMPNLEYLDISHNWLFTIDSTPFYVEVLMHPSIRVLNISKQVPLLSKHDRKKRRTDETSFQEVLTNSQMPYPVLKCIDKVTNGNISALFGSESREMVCTVAQTCFRSSWQNISCNVLPNISDILDFECAYWVKMPIGENLEELQAGYIDLDPTIVDDHELFHKNFCFRENKLTKINLEGNSKWMLLDPMITLLLSGSSKLQGLDHLSELNLQNNGLAIYLHPVKQNFPNLHSLNLSNNKQIYDIHKYSMCKDLGFSNLESLDLSNTWNALQKAPTNLVRNCATLTELRMAHTGLNSDFYLDLQSTANLKLIDVHMNNIMEFQSEFINELNRFFENKKRGIAIDLSENPLSCNCSKGSLAFLRWAHDNQESIESFSELKCSSDNSEQLLLGRTKYNVVLYECIHLDVILSVIATLSIVLVIVITICVYRFRFRLQYKCFRLHIKGQQLCVRTHKQTVDSADCLEEYKYDAFVSYSSDDRFWVHDVLMRVLEETYGFKLVIHYRDFTPGRSVHRLIDETMSNSRDFILVMTSNYLESEWCQVEMEEAYREAILRKKSLVIIVLGDVPQNIANPTARKMLDVFNYLQITHRDETDKHGYSHKDKLFWNKLVHLLYGGRHFCFCCSHGARSSGFREVRDYIGDENGVCMVENSNSVV